MKNRETYAPGGYSGFQVTWMIEWSQKSRPKKILRASNKTQKNPWTKSRLKSCTRPGTTRQCRLLYNKCDVKRHHSQLLHNSKTRLFVLYSQNYAARALPILFNTPKKSYSNQAPPKNSCQISVPKKIPQSKISNPKKSFDQSPSLEIPSTPPGTYVETA